MSSFSIRQVSHKPSYTVRTSVWKKKSLLCLALGLSVLNGGRLYGDKPLTRTAGVPVYPPYYQKGAVVQAVDQHFLNARGISFVHDIPVTLTNGTNVINFVADGYNPDFQIFYEWVGAQDYITNSAYTILTTDEQAMVSEYRFGRHFILVIGKWNQFQLNRQLSLFEMIIPKEEKKE